MLTPRLSEDRQIRSVIHSLSELEQPDISQEFAVGIRGARLLWANEALAETLFGGKQHCSNDPRLSNSLSSVSEFLMGNGAIVAQSLTGPNEVCLPIHTNGEFRTATRPPRYGRSLVVEARPLGWGGTPCSCCPSIGVLDLKGVGLPFGLKPTLENHRTGVLPLPMAIEELVNQMIVERVLAREGLDVHGVPMLGLVDPGFRARIPGSNYLPCAILIRTGHRRTLGGKDLPGFGTDAQRVQIMIEVILRKYGITSATAMTRLQLRRNSQGICAATYSGVPVQGLKPEHIENILKELGLELPLGTVVEFDAVNVQTTREIECHPLSATLVDFGHYSIATSLHRPILSLVADRPLNWGGVIWSSEITEICSCRRPFPKRFQWSRLDTMISRWSGLSQDMELPPSARFGFEMAWKWDTGTLSAQDFAREMEDFAALAELIGPE